MKAHNSERSKSVLKPRYPRLCLLRLKRKTANDLDQWFAVDDNHHYAHTHTRNPR